MPELYKLRLISFGESRIRVIKVVRDVTGLDLRESKELVESLGVVQEGVTRIAAEKTKAKLEAAGATVAVQALGEAGDGEAAEADRFSVRGRVTLANGEPAGGILAKAFDCDLRSEEELGEAATNREGRYEIVYSRDQFKRAEKYRADLRMRVFNEVGAELRTEASETVFNAGEVEEIDLRIAETEPIRPSEYRRLLALLVPVLDDASLAGLSGDDVAFLTHETEITSFQEDFPAGAQSIAFLAQGATLSGATNLPGEAFYGWAREDVGISSEDDKVRIDLSTLLEEDDETLEASLRAAIENNVITARFQDQLDSIMDRIGNLRRERDEQEREGWTRQEIVGRLLNEATSDPLVGHTVHGWRLDSAAEPEDLGRDVTNGQGQFVLELRTPPELEVEHVEARLRLRVLSEAGESIHEEQVQVTLAREGELELRVGVPEPPQPGDDVAIADLSEDLPPELQSRLDELEVRTLADVRRLGGLSRVDGISRELAEGNEARRLQAHANLYSLFPQSSSSGRIALSNKLIARGYHSPLAIAAQSEDQFARSIEGEIDVTDLARIHHVSRIHDYLTSNAWIDAVTRGGLSGSISPEGEADASTADKCGCKDCESALSPGAYLADLLGYVLKHVEKEGQPITLDWLVETFHQPFDELPLSCVSSTQEVRQVRLCAETLLRHLGEDGIQFLQMLGSEGDTYRRAVYEALLGQIGTSSNELRLTLSRDEQEQRALADRLGIGREHLAGLRLDTEAHALTPGALSERALQRIFGLRALTNIQIATNTPRVVIRDPLGEVETPLFETWQLEHLRKQWQERDFPADSFSKGTRPRIDPDLLSPEDFRTPGPNVSKAYALWTKRRRWIDDRLNELSRIREQAADDKAALQALFDHLQQAVTYDGTDKTPWPTDVTIAGIIDMNARLETGNDVAELNQEVETLHLDSDAFRRLAEAVTLAANGTPIEEKAWREVLSLLVQAQKRVFFEPWWAEEESADPEADPAGLLDPRTFWIALREPEAGLWSPALEQERPLIDPDTVDEDDLLSGPVGEAARAKWAERKRQLDEARANIALSYEQGKLAAALQEALGASPDANLAWPEYLIQLDNDLRSLDGSTRQAAEQSVRDQLHMPTREFSYLMAVKAKEDAGQEPDSEALKGVVNTLTSARKAKEFTSVWAQEEVNLDLSYWKALRARLPRWRADQTARQEWQQALRALGRPPIIDPDLIQDDDFANPVPGDPALEIWQTRYAQIEGVGAAPGKLAEISTPDVGAAGDRRAAFDEKLGMHLGISLDEMLELDRSEEAGNRIQGRLEQLNVTRDGFTYLLRAAKSVDGNEDISDDTWPNVYAILLQVWKRRMFAVWRRGEQEQGLMLGPQHFKILPKAYFPTPERETLPVQWRWDGRIRRDWERTLKARVEQEQTLHQGLEEAVEAVEEDTLPQLRDALIEESPATGETFAAKAKWLADRLLIDTQESGCRTTTRIAQAIEVLQMLAVSTRSGQFDFANEIGLNVAANDERGWQWIGSYSTWRAAMGVFLFPDTILLPSLRRLKTPVFRALLGETQTNTRLNKNDACLIASRYTEYLRDVFSLQVDATCWGLTQVIFKKEDACSGQTEEQRNLLFQFAQSAETGALYWSAYDRTEPEEYSQTFWTRIDLDDDSKRVEIVGVVTYGDPRTSHYRIFLFLKRNNVEDTGYSLFYVHRELEIYIDSHGFPGGSWADSSSWEVGEDVAMPGDAKWFDVVVAQAKSARAWPTVAVRIADFFAKEEIATHEVGDPDPLYLLQLNPDTEEWHAKPLVDKPRPRHLRNLRLLAMVAVSQRHDAYEDYDETRYFLVVENRRLSAQGSVADAHLSVILLGLKRNDVRIDGEHHQVLRPEDAVLERLNDETFARHTGAEAWKGALPAFPMGDVERKGILVFWEKKPFDIGHAAVVENAVGDAVARRGTDSLQFLNREGLKFAVHSGDSFRGELNTIVYSYSYKSRRTVMRTEVVLPADLQSRKVRQSGDIRLAVPTTGTNGLGAPPVAEWQGGVDVNERRRTIADLYTANKPLLPQSQLTYLDEAYLSIPVHVALALRRAQNYEDALQWLRGVYDYSRPHDERKVSYRLALEHAGAPDFFDRADDWLIDPINPHGIAATRAVPYTRFTLFALIRCLLDYAEAEFTMDTAESLARARTLFETASEILEAEELESEPNPCESLLQRLDELEEEFSRVPAWSSWRPVWLGVRDDLAEIENYGRLKEIVENVGETARQDTPLADRMTAIARIARGGQVEHSKPPTLAWLRREQSGLRSRFFEEQLGDLSISRRLERAAGFSGGQLWGRSGRGSEGTTDAAKAGGSEIGSPRFSPGLSLHFCIPDNPILDALRLRVETGLYKLRNCMNIAGMRRELEPYAAPTDVGSALPTIGTGGQLSLPSFSRVRPTLYRYAVLVDRAKQLVHLAQQTESAMLSALEKRDQAAYTEFQARQETQLARAGVRLQDLRLQEAESGVELAALQQERAEIQSETYAQWIAEGLNEYESNMLDAFVAIANFQTLAAASGAVAQAAKSMASANAVRGWGFAIAASAAAAAQASFSSLAAHREASVREWSLRASHERRKQQWELQLALAHKDIAIGRQQVGMAGRRVRVVTQEHKIAQTRMEQASEAVEFLRGSFTNRELYEWMSGVLEEVYRYFLQQAAATAKLAENQLAFERQEVPAQYIQTDYWSVSGGGFGFDQAESNDSDRRGLTGSARLLRDLHQLDQHAFTTDQRKLQLTETISLARLDPFAFQQFRETGVIVFDTPMELFDSHFPGHYLRLVKRVRTSVVALTPPSHGIKATLSSSGISRVVTGGDVFQTTVIRRDPESVALTSPVEATGTFELNLQPEMYNFFEGNGVDTRWELSLPKAANPFDYRSLADVLITIEYTALHSYDFERQVVQRLDPYVSSDRALSFRNEFPDAWYDLHNPDQTGNPMSVRFETRRQDFPPNVTEPRIQHVVLYFAGVADQALQADLRFTDEENGVSVGGEALPIDGVISTRRGNASSWLAMVGKSVAGDWQLSLPDTPEVRRLFKDEKIEDILFVITYEGERPSWPGV